MVNSYFGSVNYLGVSYYCYPATFVTEQNSTNLMVSGDKFKQAAEFVFMYVYVCIYATVNVNATIY